MKQINTYITENINVNENAKYDKDILLDYLEDMKCDYDLDGCELSEEDANRMIYLMKKGMSKQKAADAVLQGIRDVISQGWEF